VLPTASPLLCELGVVDLSLNNSFICSYSVELITSAQIVNTGSQRRFLFLYFFTFDGYADIFYIYKSAILV
jgi:hypothetical protein